MARTNDKAAGVRTRSLLRISEAAAVLGISPRQAYRWADAGRLPTIQLGGLARGRYVPRAALEALLREGALAALEDAATRRNERTS